MHSALWNCANPLVSHVPLLIYTLKITKIEALSFIYQKKNFDCNKAAISSVLYLLYVCLLAETENVLTAREFGFVIFRAKEALKVNIISKEHKICSEFSIISCLPARQSCAILSCALQERQELWDR